MKPCRALYFSIASFVSSCLQLVRSIDAGLCIFFHCVGVDTSAAGLRPSQAKSRSTGHARNVGEISTARVRHWLSCHETPAAVPDAGLVFVFVFVLLCSRQEYDAAVEAFHRREDMKSLLKLKATRRVSDGAPDLDKEPPVFKNGGSLRDYQREVGRGPVFQGCCGLGGAGGGGRRGGGAWFLVYGTCVFIVFRPKQLRCSCHGLSDLYRSNRWSGGLIVTGYVLEFSPLFWFLIRRGRVGWLPSARVFPCSISCGGVPLAQQCVCAIHLTLMLCGCCC